ncbi:MAG: UDP-N-acetylmuramate dehydrogenase [Leptolyngbyaceae bacterium]|nr:UDP-N-acetylmuramate dehydrogenase [Leptolyngbyaceae bacterium]
MSPVTSQSVSLHDPSVGARADSLNHSDSTFLRSCSYPLGSSFPELIPIRHTPYHIRRCVSLARFTSFRVGGTAEFFIAPQHLDELQAAIAWADHESVPVTLIGAGSNLLISDRGLSGLVICTRRLKSVQLDAETGELTASAGESLVRLAWRAAEQGLSGLEWAVGIPGTVGGAVVMNAGAHAGSTADILINAQTLDRSGNSRTFQQQDLNFDYRTSLLQQSDLLVTQASFQLQPGRSPEEVIQATREHLRQRHQTQPYHLPSCGSVFRNPSPQKAGWLIEQAGLKGYQIGGAQVAEQHANFILNVGHATATDIFFLIQHVQEQVKEQWTLLLRPEVKFMGEF